MKLIRLIIASLMISGAVFFTVGCEKSDEDKAKDAMEEGAKDAEGAAKDAADALQGE